MGYRSEVGIKCEPKAFDALMEACTQCNYEPDEVLEDGEYKVLHWYDVKWSAYYGTDAIEKCMETLNFEHEYDSDDGLGYSFIRLGEDSDDVETMSNDYNIPFWVVRKIDLPEPLGEKEEKKQMVKKIIDEIKNGIEKTEEQIDELLDRIF